MVRFLAARLLQTIIVLLAVAAIVVLLRSASGDPAAMLLPPDATPADIAGLNAQLGFDQPLWIQFWRFVVQIVHGQFGFSWRLQEPVIDLLFERVPATALLAVSALAVSLVIAVPLGVLSATRRDTPFDSLTMIVALIGQSIPVYWLGLMLILVFAVGLRLVPTSGADTWSSLILPAVSLGLGLSGRNARLVRSSMLEQLGEEYARSARARGLSEWAVIGKHVLKNALLPIVTVVGLELGGLLGGAVITETVFEWPGMGLLAYQALAGRDYPVVQAAILVGALVFVVVNLLVDLVYMLLDPRIALGPR